MPLFNPYKVKRVRPVVVLQGAIVQDYWVGALTFPPLSSVNARLKWAWD